jgi:acyl dehydratase
MTAATHPKTLSFAAIQVGDEMKPLEINVTASVVVAGAIASRDFMPVHHDRDYANAQGAPDIFMNILTTNGLTTRFLTDWGGPESMLKHLAIRLGVPSMPGSILRFTGNVTGKSQGTNEGLVDVAFRGTNDLGDHVSGTATLSLPLGGGAA